MSPPDRLLQIARWRWTPLVIPTVGTSLFVMLLAWLVPEDLGQTGAHTRRPAVAGLELHAPSDDDTDENDRPVPSVTPVGTHVSTQPAAHQPNRRRGFSPPLERPNEPPPPPPPPVETPPPPPPPVSEGPNSDRWRDGQQAASNAATHAGARAGALAARVRGRNQALAEPMQVEAPPADTPPAEPAPSTNDVPDAPPAPQ